jgi:hypothetical protein
MKHKTDHSWRDRQKKVFANWINNKLRERIKTDKVKPVIDVNNDLKDGFVIYHLLEVRSRSESGDSLGDRTTCRARCDENTDKTHRSQCR